MYKKLMEWLSSGSTDPFLFKKGCFKYVIACVPRTAEIEYLFSQSKVDDETISKDCFEYAGLYNKKDGLLYDANAAIFSDLYEWHDLMTRTEEALLQHLNIAVRARVEAMIGNDRNKLTVTEISDPWLKKVLQNMEKRGAANVAHSIYLGKCNNMYGLLRPSPAIDGKMEMCFRCGYESVAWSENEMISYILDSEGFAQKQAEKYLNEHQESCLLQFLTNDLIEREYERISADKENPVHFLKRIMAVMNSSSAKTVNVTISKKGTDLTMKVDADDLRRDPEDGSYRTWCIAAPDRKRFKALFGASADYRPEDIVQIMYGKKVLYTR